MYCFHDAIQLRATDASGGIYFTEVLSLASKAFQTFLHPSSFSVKKILTSSYLMPVVHAESDFVSPLYVDDAVQIQMYLAKIGTSSFTLGFDFFHQGTALLAATAKITHVLVLKSTQKATPLPDELKEILTSLCALSQRRG